MAVQATSNEDLKAEINVTPLVDVVLVLLIIFMVVTPLLKQEVPIELPIADNSRNTDAAQVTLSLTLDERTLVNGVEVAREELVARLTEMYAGRADKTIFLEADRALPHGRIVDLMDDARAAGVVQIGVVTKKDPNPPAPRSALENVTAGGGAPPAPPPH
jgi:biopolymer transport protein ExbD